ncbi:MAG: RNB domain-containing ribonuclease [Deltaproteobacteria bacterium]|jgi:exoribonuclease-2|nr:RNB domain-containing ribonuclease [Deltaproteobacteria bacterium]
MSHKPVVEFLEGGGFLLAWALEAPAGVDKNLEVLAPGGRLARLSPGRILVSASCPDPGDKPGRLAFLEDLRKKREALAQSLPLEEVWRVLEGEGPQFDYELLAGLAFGRDPGPDELSAIRRAVLADGVLFAFSPQAATRHSQEEADKKRLLKKKKLAHQEFLSQGAKWLAEAKARRVAPEPESADRIRSLLLDLAINEAEAHDPRTAKELLKAAALAETPQGAFTALVAIGEFHPHECLDVRRLGLGQPFTEEEKEAARRVSASFSLTGGPRVDLTCLSALTIDSEGAREYDDALTLTPGPDGSFRLGLHIADVAAAVLPGDILDEAARRRAASIYLPDAKHSMLPEELTDGLLSLKLGEVRPAYSLLVELDAYGAPISHSFAPSVVKVARQLSFDEADALLGQDEELDRLSDLGRLLLNRRLEYGGQNLALPQPHVRLAPDGQILLGKTTWDTPARLMVGEMMILANHLAAETLARERLACPFRYQEKSRGRPLLGRPPKDPKEALAQDLALRRLVGRGGIALTPSPHWGLGLPCYAQFTSPIRRYADLLVARQLRSLNDPALAPYDHAAMTQLAYAADELHRGVKRAQNARTRYFLTLALANKIGEEFVGLIYERQQNRARVCLTDFMLELDLFKLPPEARPGREARLRLAQADAADQILRFEFVGLV